MEPEVTTVEKEGDAEGIKSIKSDHEGATSYTKRC